MTVCIVASGVPHAVSRTLSFSRNFSDLHFIDVSGKADSGRLEEAGIRYWGPTDFRFDYRGLRRLFRRLQPELIICHFCSGPHFFGAIAYGQCPVVGIVMGSDVLYEQGDKSIPFLWPLLIRMGIRRLAYISAKSRHLKEVCQTLGVERPVAVNYWGSDLQAFRDLSKADARSATALPQDRFILLSPRTISPLYNIDTIIEAMPAIVEEVPKALLVLLGREVSEYRQRLEQRIDDLGLQERVRIMGEVAADRMADYINASDAVISMARTEGFPNTALEVLGCQRPLIIGRLEQVQEILADGEDCLMPEIDPADIAAAVTRLAHDPGLMKRLSAAGRQKAAAFGDIRVNGQNFADDIRRHVSDNEEQRPGALFYRLIFLLFRLQKKLRGR